MPYHSYTLCSILVCTPALIEDLVQGYEDDSVAKQLLKELAITAVNDKGYTLD